MFSSVCPVWPLSVWPLLSTLSVFNDFSLTVWSPEETQVTYSVTFHKISSHSAQIVRISSDINIEFAVPGTCRHKMLRQSQHLGTTRHSDTQNKQAFCVPFFHADEQSVGVRLKTVKLDWKHPERRREIYFYFFALTHCGFTAESWGRVKEMLASCVWRVNGESSTHHLHWQVILKSESR